MKVAALQMVSGTDLDANLRAARALLEEAAQAGAELALLPEYFCLLGRRDTDKLAIREADGSGTIQQFLSDAARALKIWIVGGTLPLATDDPARVRNSSLVYAPHGARVVRYDKIHLFRFDDGEQRYDEARVLEAGSEPALFELTDRAGRAWRVGLSVCYDLRFPELYRRYAAQGADLLLVPSAFTFVTGRAHWELLLRARAVENLCYVLAAAQGGLHENGRRTWGHSLAVDPWGALLAQRPEGAGVVLAELDTGQIARRRRELPALSHRVL
ncbi:MAG: carbon-nitrogen hydrolase family protein [Burkholderiaceae bacterium]|jgi:nitrilase|nr:MAG: carbon-nitrogen hydrolase family protein [Burkholderiaceae bacterium]